MTTDSNELTYEINDELMTVMVPARKTTLIYFIAPPIAVFSIAAVVIIFPVFYKSDLFIGSVILFLFFSLFLYMGVTSLLALLWTLFGKDCITIDQKGIRVDRVLFFSFASSYYQRDKIFNIYVNSRDYEVNKISRGKNDFVSVFRIGTIHFYYDEKLQHIAGGMTNEEGKIFLERLNMQS